MKSQDILLLLKLASIDRQRQYSQEGAFREPLPHSWQDWEEPEAALLDELFGTQSAEQATLASKLSMRGLSNETGISKSEISQSLKRSYYSGLAKPDRMNGLPKANVSALLEFVIHGIRYVFPVRPAELTRGIATSLAAPVLHGRLMTAGELAAVWPDARGNSTGQAVSPLFKTVPFAVRRDPQLYGYLALVDAIRIGQPRERKLASKLLEASLQGEG